MVSSILSKNKEVVAIVPVKNLNAESLKKMIVDVLKLLHKTGFMVLTIMADNNRINRNAFTTLYNGTLQPMIHNPVSGRPLFFLFDTIHLMKCIRNNWLAQNDAEKNLSFSPNKFHQHLYNCISYGTPINIIFTTRCYNFSQTINIIYSRCYSFAFTSTFRSIKYLFV